MSLLRAKRGKRQSGDYRGVDLSSASNLLADISQKKISALETGRTRLMVTACIFMLAFSLIAGRLLTISLPLVGRDMTSDEPEVARTAPPVQTKRANIVDRNGLILATSLESKSVYANPHHILDPGEVALQLSTVFQDVSPRELTSKLRSNTSFTWIKRFITPRQAQAVINLGIPGLYFHKDEKRIYPLGSLVSHITGFTDIDNNGLAGAEKSLNNRLQTIEDDVQLTIDLRLQHILSEELNAAITTFDAIGGAGIIMDSKTGEILALVSLPSFDPDNPAAATTDERFNRATLGVYELGSVFKIFTTALALEEKTVTLGDGYDTSRPLKEGSFTIDDYHGKKRWLSVPEIFIYSSNIGTARMALDVGADKQKLFLDKLGLLSKPKLELPEIGNPMWPRTWRRINTMTISYGHGIAITPLQMTRALAATINGGFLVNPSLVKHTAHETKVAVQVIDRDVSDKIRWLMRLNVLEGTGKKANVDGYDVGGKTGTADKLKPSGGYSQDEKISSFAGAFPMHDPRYAIFVMVDAPKGTKQTYGYATGGWVAAPIVRNVIARTAPLLGIQPDWTPDREKMMSYSNSTYGTRKDKAVASR